MGRLPQPKKRGYSQILLTNRDNSLPELDLRSRIEFGFRLAIPDVTGIRGIGLWGPRIRAILPPKDVLTGRLLVYGHFSTN